MNQLRKDVLNGWKEIAHYVGRDIRTVERWEKQRGLPIRRVPGDGRAPVYAVVSELERWFISANGDQPLTDDSALASSVQPSAVSSVTQAQGDPAVSQFHVQAADAVAVTASPVGETTSAQTLERLQIFPRSSWRGTVLALLVLGVFAFAFWKLSHRFSVQGSSRSVAGPAASSVGSTYRFDEKRTTPGLPYPSHIAEVDNLCLRGIYFYEQRTSASLKHAEDSFALAIAKDSNYAPAYAGLSITYLLQREYSAVPDQVAYTKAMKAAQRAIALDPRLPLPHVSQGFTDFFWIGDAVGAEREFRLALSLDPSLVIAHHWYGSVLTHEGRYPQAIQELDIAQHLQPTSAAVLSSRALAIGLSGHRAEASELLQEQLNEGPQATSPHQMFKILSLMEPHDIPQWLRENRQMARMRNDTATLEDMNVAEAAYQRGGEAAMWQALYDHERVGKSASALPTYAMGSYQAALGNNDAAFAIMMPFAQRRAPETLTMGMDPLFENLRRDPRFAQMFAYTGIPDAMKLP